MQSKDYLLEKIEENYRKEEFGKNTLVSIDNYEKVLFFGATEDIFFLKSAMAYLKLVICDSLIKQNGLDILSLYQTTSKSSNVNDIIGSCGEKISALDTDVKTLVGLFKQNGLNATFEDIVLLSHKYVTIYKGGQTLNTDSGIESESISGEDMDIKTLIANKTIGVGEEICDLLKKATGKDVKMVYAFADPRAMEKVNYYVSLTDDELELLKSKNIITSYNETKHLPDIDVYESLIYSGSARIIREYKLVYSRDEAMLELAFKIDQAVNEGERDVSGNMKF